uniref:Mobilization protein n=1 Tax=Lactococcus lactis subsp. lactis TaxID=1360 RepID=A0AAC9R2Q1_LACLL
MNKDEQLVVQVLNAYKNGKIDFSKVPELEILIRQEVNKDFRDYQQKIEAVANQKIEEALQEQLHRLDAENLKTDVLKEIQKEKQDLLVLKKELQVQREKTNIDTHREALESYSIIIANIVCLLCFLVVGALLGQWIYKGIWDGWGLHLLYDTVLPSNPNILMGQLFLD